MTSGSDAVPGGRRRPLTSGSDAVSAAPSKPWTPGGDPVPAATPRPIAELVDELAELFRRGGTALAGDAVFNRVWTMLHAPCLHLPVDDGPGGLPLGVQLVAPHGDEAALLGAARWLARRLGLPLFG